MTGNKKYILRFLYPDGSFAGILNQDDFVEPPQFSMELNGTISELRIKTSMTFLEWLLPPDGIETDNTFIDPPEGYTGPTVQTRATGAERQYNTTYIGNLAQLCIVDTNGEETQIWSGVYTGIEINFENNKEEVMHHLFIPNASRLATRIFRNGTLTKFTMTADPADMVKAILNSADIGISYTPDSIENLGENRTYEFNVRNCQEALDAVFALLPSNWFYYIGGDDILYMGTIETISAAFNVSTAQMKNFKVEKQINTMRNRLLFLGASGTFLQINAAASQNAFGIFEERISDPGQTNSDDMTEVAVKLLGQTSAMQTTITVEIMDSNLAEGGFDIDQLRPGDQLTVHHDFGDLSFTYWGSFTWGTDQWKYDAYAIAGIPAIIKRLTYKLNSVIAECSFNYQNLNQFIIKIDKEVKELQFADAPTEPTEV